MRVAMNYTLNDLCFCCQFLTAGEEGIVGLRTGVVSTFPLNESPAQSWIFTWERKFEKLA